MGEETRPVLGITMGDASGVGPEIIAKALSLESITSICRPLVIGDAQAMYAALEITGLAGQVKPVANVGEASFEHRVIDVLDLQNLDLDGLVRGQISSMAGRAAFEYIQEAVKLVLASEIGGIATAPINKEALNKAGYHYAGHTEILADLCGVKDVAMMLVAGDFRVSHVSTHVSLREACDRVTRERILTVVQLTDQALRRMGIEDPRLAVASLNPHAGEGGIFGREEIEIIGPATEEARQMGLDVAGPLPADTVFYQALYGQDIGVEQFDAVIAMYHDQGHIPIKLIGFREGVNVTLGLPVIRTSVDHGTAFDKAGKGTADPESLIEAIKLGTRMMVGNLNRNISVP